MQDARYLSRRETDAIQKNVNNFLKFQDRTTGRTYAEIIGENLVLDGRIGRRDSPFNDGRDREIFDSTVYSSASGLLLMAATYNVDAGQRSQISDSLGTFNGGFTNEYLGAKSFLAGLGNSLGKSFTEDGITALYFNSYNGDNKKPLFAGNYNSNPSYRIAYDSLFGVGESLSTRLRAAGPGLAIMAASLSVGYGAPKINAGLNNYVSKTGNWVPTEQIPDIERVRGANRIGFPVTKSANPLSPVLERDAYGNEIMYRTMPEKQFVQLSKTGKLPPTTETSISPSVDYSSKYDGVTVKITVAPGTSAQLQEIGIAANKPAAIQFPGMSTQTGSWMQTNARFKVEGGQMTTQLGQGKAIDIFNKNIVDYELVRKGGH